MKQKRWKYIQLNNSGSALISVVAVAIFLSVIATTIIYISGKNYQIKANDYQNKKHILSGGDGARRIKRGAGC